MIKNILFDFDGVIIDSMPIREAGFRLIFQDFDKYLVDKLIDYHNQNGGLSRYAKIKYFFEVVLGKTISENDILKFAHKFSLIMREKLTNKKYLINDTLDFLKENHGRFNLHIVSGSDENELRFLCRQLNIDSYFLSINGSPAPKNKLVKCLMESYDYLLSETILIGDSVNDYDAAQESGISFYGYNNDLIKEICDKYIDKFYLSSKEDIF